ncbi:unnamed protein product [Didymodactylos carnosus]|uniref:Uncharacterized protein n=1 Tax=Didymodactylos carnosus TaxID=1234261 RepID=A0A814K514_9BILA|nr:unnamed protein product [Didymodactylos carnosus]CAF1046987.1 unnamed protein product [Didymodactylos carnosus]CAF3733647.1 unnamed protein product [Didymodactylos carnosus]CAF3816760.1 unnamed protein product [Didymodactylos carnosus]
MEELATLPSAFSVGIHGLRDRAHLQDSEYFIDKTLLFEHEQDLIERLANELAHYLQEEVKACTGDQAQMSETAALCSVQTNEPIIEFDEVMFFNYNASIESSTPNQITTDLSARCSFGKCIPLSEFNLNSNDEGFVNDLGEYEALDAERTINGVDDQFNRNLLASDQISILLSSTVNEVEHERFLADSAFIMQDILELTGN